MPVFANKDFLGGIMFHVGTLILKSSWLKMCYSVARGGLSCLEMLWLQHRLRLGELGVWAEPERCRAQAGAVLWVLQGERGFVHKERDEQSLPRAEFCWSCPGALCG